MTIQEAAKFFQSLAEDNHPDDLLENVLTRLIEGRDLGCSTPEADAFLAAVKSQLVHL